MENLPAIAKMELSGLPRKAAAVAGLLREIANEKRLLILCELAGLGEVTVADLAQRVGLGQSAVSQHLARMRAKGLPDSLVGRLAVGM